MQETMEFITTERLVLRVAAEQDMVPLVSDIFTDAAVTQYLFTKKNEVNGLSRGEAEKYIRNKLLFRPAPYGLRVLALKKTNEIIGIGGLLRSILLKGEKYEFCFALKKEQWGKGYATEIGHAQINYGFNRLCLPELYASVYKENRASIKVLNRLNLTQVDSQAFHNSWLIYVITNQDCDISAD